MRCEEAPLKGMYPATESVIDWLSNTFGAVEEGGLLYWLELRNLTKAVDRAEKTKSFVYRAQAMSMLRDYNEESGSSITYDEIAERNIDFVPSYEGEWVAFSEDPMSLFHWDDDIYELEWILYGAPESVKWVIVWEVQEGYIVVYRSPIIEGRFQVDMNYHTAEGLLSGDSDTFVLPPAIEAAIKQDQDDYNGSEGGPYGAISEFYLHNPGQLESAARRVSDY